ncbi:MAG: hypothetical protein M3173_04180 [Chloroflexota bacterium]|nr:hypothetical protein [Chloroflexota bacterium]
MFPGLNVPNVEAVRSRQIDLYAMACHRSAVPIVPVPLPSGPHQIVRQARVLAGTLAFLHLRHAPKPAA